MLRRRTDECSIRSGWGPLCGCGAGMPNLLRGKEGHDITFYTKERQSSDLFGKKIKAKASWRGDEHGGRWWVYDVRVLQ